MKIIAAILGFAYLAFGFWAFYDLPSLLASFGVVASGVNGVWELKSNYGGINTALGLSLLLSCFFQKIQAPAFFAGIVINFGYVAGRITSILMGDSGELHVTEIIVFETFLALTCAIGYILARRKQKAL